MCIATQSIYTRLMYEWRDSIILEQEVFIEHIPCANVYGIECYNYSSSADSATPRD